MMRNIKGIGIQCYLLGESVFAEAVLSPPERAEFNRLSLDTFSQSFIQDMEFGNDDGAVVRVGYSKLGYLSHSLVFFKGGLLLSWNFEHNAFGLVPTFKTGVAPLFIGLSRVMFDRQNAGLLNYEFGLTLYVFEAKVALADFQRASLFFCPCRRSTAPVLPAGTADEAAPPFPRGSCGSFGGSGAARSWRTPKLPTSSRVATKGSSCVAGIPGGGPSGTL